MGKHLKPWLVVALLWSIVVGAQGMGHGGLRAVPTPQTITTADLSLYVATTGDNGNGCTSVSSPCLTVTGALGKVPKNIAHTVTINVAAGTYTGTTTIDGFFISSAGKLLIKGATPVAAAGSSTGTTTGYSALSFPTLTTITDSNQSWTVNEWKGYHVLLNGTYTPVVSNTSTALSVASTISGGASSQAYTIVDFPTIFTNSTANTHNFVLGNNVGLIQLELLDLRNTGTGSAHNIDSELNPGLVTTTSSGAPNATWLLLIRMRMSTSAGYCLFARNMQRVEMGRSYCVGTSTSATNSGFRIDNGNSALIASSYVKTARDNIVNLGIPLTLSTTVSEVTGASGIGYGTSAIDFAGASYSITTYKVICGNAAGKGLFLSGSRVTGTVTSFASEGCGTGIEVEDAAHLAVLSGGTLSFSNATDGLYLNRTATARIANTVSPTFSTVTNEIKVVSDTSTWADGVTAGGVTNAASLANKSYVRFDTP